MKKFLQALSAFVFSLWATTSMAQDFYKSWPKLEVGNFTWYVDQESVAKVGDSVFFDGFMEARANTDGMTFDSPARSGFACDGGSYIVVSEPWVQDQGRAYSGELKSALNNRRSVELNPTFVEIKRSDRTPSFRDQLSTFCKSRKRADRDMIMSVAMGADEVSVARLATFQRVSPAQVEVWIDTLEFSTMEIMGFKDFKLVPTLNEDGTPKTARIVGDHRTTVYKRRYDCERNRSVVIQYNEYDKKGNSSESFIQKTPIPADSWREAVPGTVGENVLLMICRL